MPLELKSVALPATITIGASTLAFSLWRRNSAILKLNILMKSHLSIGPDSNIYLVSKEEDWHTINHVILQDLKHFPFLGLDTEWVNDKGQNKAVSMLQLATCSGTCVLVRLCFFTRIPESLRDLLANPQIIKVGVSVLDDSDKMLVDYNVEVASCVDLRHLAVLQSSAPGKLGLQSLAEEYLSVNLDKDWRIRSGNWEAQELNERQITYAANDALVAINILWRLLYSQLTPDISTTLKSYTWTHKQVLMHCRKQTDRFLDLKFSNKEWKLNKKRSTSRECKDKIDSKLTKSRGNAVRKSPLYHNCMLQAPDGQILCTCDIKKAEWYLKKGIGEMISEDPFTVRLKFEPSGRPEGKAGEYYLSVKPNICVVCGAEESYLRKNVVPHEYRRYFPAVMKDHQSHDVLLMCVKCHQISNLHDASLRSQLALECQAPIGTENDIKLRDNFDLKKVKSAGRALKNSKSNLPQSRRDELSQILKDHYQVEEITVDIINMASDCNFHEVNSNYTPHSRAVVQHYLKEGGLLQLEVRWRKHFLATMKPKHLPALWSITHQEERLGVKAAENRIDQEQYRLATKGAVEDIDLEEYRKQKKSQLGINPDDHS